MSVDGQGSAAHALCDRVNEHNGLAQTGAVFRTDNSTHQLHELVYVPGARINAVLAEFQVTATCAACRIIFCWTPTAVPTANLLSASCGRYWKFRYVATTKCLREGLMDGKLTAHTKLLESAGVGIL